MLKPLDVASAAVACVVFALGVATLAVENAMVTSLKHNAYNDGYIDGKQRTCYPFRPGQMCVSWLTLIPQNFLIGVTRAIFAAASICVVAGFLSFNFAVFNSRAKSEKETRQWSLASCAISCICAVMALITFIVAFIEESKSSIWHYWDEDSTDQQFTAESWTCQMQHQLITNDENNWAFWAPACANAAAGRWLTFPLFCFSIVLAVLATLDYRRRLFSYQRASVDDEHSEPKDFHQSNP